jgi:hypothetical protein
MYIGKTDRYCGKTDRWFRERAQELYGRDGRVEFDSDAIISRGDEKGAYVEAWVWVPYKEEDLD